MNIRSFGIINDEWTETGFLGLNILVNCLSSSDLEICGQAAAKLNSIIHNRTVNSSEEACYFIYFVEAAMQLHAGSNYAFLLPVLKR